jgi:MFS family permease
LPQTDGLKLLAFGIRNMDGVGGYRGWRWIFIIEGLLTVLATGIGLLFIPDYPENSKFLKPEEKEYMLQMLKVDDSINDFENMLILESRSTLVLRSQTITTISS